MRLIGYSTEEVMGRSLVQEFITDDFKTAVQAVLDLALAGDETGACVYVHVCVRGSVRLRMCERASTLAGSPFEVSAGFVRACFPLASPLSSCAPVAGASAAFSAVSGPIDARLAVVAWGFAAFSSMWFGAAA